MLLFFADQAAVPREGEQLYEIGFGCVDTIDSVAEIAVDPARNGSVARRSRRVRQAARVRHSYFRLRAGRYRAIKGIGHRTHRTDSGR
jgi:hypothetical protein